MKKNLLFRRLRAHLLLSLLTVTLLGACSKDDKPDAADPAAPGDGTITWTHSGTTYTSTAYSSAIVDSPTKFIITGSSADLNNVVSLVIFNLDTKGVGTYDLRKGSVLNDLPMGALTLNGAGGQGSSYNSLYGPNPSNGTLTVTQYDKANQKISGTFSFTAGAAANSGGTGNQSVTNGTFSFTRFR